jgi:hypothetical protein
MRTAVSFGAALLLLTACGGDDTQPEPDGGEELVAPQCDDPQSLCLDEPENGFQIRSSRVEIAAGQDVEYCEIVAVPGDPSETFYVDAFESQMTQGSHHLIVNALEVGSEDEQQYAPGDRFECFATTAFADTIALTGSQAPYNAQKFPEGVGKTVHGGQLIVVNYHYFNTSGESIQAEAAVNFHLADAEEIEKEAQQFGMVNFTFEVPPMSTATFDEECSFSQDVMVYGLTRHTHRWGTDFSAWFVGGPRDGELAFTSDHYEKVAYPFDEPVLMPAGTGFKWECNFDNTEDYPLTFGEKATDEMCILFGGWYTVNADDPVTRQGCIR